MHACKTIYAMVVLCWFPSVPQHTVLREKRVNMKYYYPEKMNMHQQEVGEKKEAKCLPRRTGHRQRELRFPLLGFLLAVGAQFSLRQQKIRRRDVVILVTI